MTTTTEQDIRNWIAELQAQKDDPVFYGDYLGLEQDEEPTDYQMEDVCICVDSAIKKYILEQTNIPQDILDDYE